MSHEENHVGNLIAGTSLGALTGAGMGLGVCMTLIDHPPFFPGDTILMGAIVCGMLGFLLGSTFIDWLKENWLSFWY